MKQYYDRRLSMVFGSSQTFKNVIDEYEIVYDVLGADTFKKIWVELVDRTCNMFNIYDSAVSDFKDYIEMYFNLDDEENYKF